jgi:hypothetical protein
MSHGWDTTTLTSEEQAVQVLADLLGKRWLCRGQSNCYECLTPSIDRGPLFGLSRLDKLSLERRSIDLFRSVARSFADPGEQGALVDDIVALMVLRHYGVPTRLLDWSRSPFVAAYFACNDDPKDNGEIWTFDQPLYAERGKKQWERWRETTIDGDPTKFDACLTAFTVEEPPDWFVCHFYQGFPRQNAQAGAYSMTARFGRDHADAIAKLLDDSSRYRLYVVTAALKPTLLECLHKNHGIWRGSLFPDSAGAAESVRSVLFKALK